MTSTPEKRRPTDGDGNGSPDADMQGPPSPPKGYRRRASTPPAHSAPGQARREPCTLPDLWITDPRLQQHRGILDEVMERVHDWADLFDMVRTGMAGKKGKE
jgi:hypothetical protein